jgi:hypothetical protein
VILAGDARLSAKLRREELLPLGSRIRTRLNREYASRESLLECLKHLQKSAGNASLMTAELMNPQEAVAKRVVPIGAGKLAQHLSGAGTQHRVTGQHRLMRDVAGDGADLPTPLGPTKMALAASCRKARPISSSMASRSQRSGQFRSKSAKERKRPRCALPRRRSSGLTESMEQMT